MCVHQGYPYEHIEEEYLMDAENIFGFLFLLFHYLQTKEIAVPQYGLGGKANGICGRSYQYRSPPSPNRRLL